MAITYDDALKRAKENNIDLGAVTAADKALMKSDPKLAMSMVQNWIDYNNATTDEARALANANQNKLRASAGGYTAGGNGLRYDLVQNDPSSQTGLQSMLDRYALNAYTDPRGYDALYGQKLGEVLDYGDFKYDPGSDPLYKTYRDQYTRGGQLAMEDTLGKVSARTGGLASSYAEQAAQQTYDRYMDALNDKIPELYARKYGEYTDGYNRALSALGAAGSAANADYERWQTDQDRMLNAYKMGSAAEAEAYERARDEREKELERAVADATAGNFSALAGYYGVDEDTARAYAIAQKWYKEQPSRPAVKNSGYLDAISYMIEAYDAAVKRGVKSQGAKGAAQSALNDSLRSGKITSDEYNKLYSILGE